MIARYAKDPNDVLDYGEDWSAWLGADTIAASSWLVPAGIIKNSDGFTPTTTTIWLAGGTAGMQYRLVNRITTVGGRTKDRSIDILVDEE